MNSQSLAPVPRSCATAHDKAPQQQRAIMAADYQIVFSGKTREGLDPSAVKRAAAQRLKASPEMAERIFSGQRVIFKKGLNGVEARQYLETLEKLGMLAEIVAVESAAPTAAEPPANIPAAFDAERVGSNLAHAMALLDRIAAVPLSA